MNSDIDLGVFVARSRLFESSLDVSKMPFHRAANAVFGKVGRTASEEVTLHLHVLCKCFVVWPQCLSIKCFRHTIVTFCYKSIFNETV